MRSDPPKTDRGDNARLFFAADPDAAALKALGRCQQSLQQEPWQRHVKWTPAGHMHLTLKFLGATPRQSIDDIVRYVQDKLAVPAVDTRIDDLHLFPNRKRPTVVAATLADDDCLSRLADALDKLMIAFGYEPERRKFRPHITIGRCRKGFPRGVDISGRLANPIPCRLDRVILYESVTRRAGAEYTEIARFIPHEND